MPSCQQCAAPRGLRRPPALAVAVTVLTTVLAGCSGAALPAPAAAVETGSTGPARTPVATAADAMPAVSPAVHSPAVHSLAATRAASAPRAARYAFPIARCPVRYQHAHHDYPATDVFAKRGCAFVAVTGGVVDEVSRVDRWSPSRNGGGLRGGRFVSIVGDDGVRYYGSHLLDVAPGIAPGVRVRAGQLLGHVGNSGDARYVATHVHFGISWPTGPGVWWVRRGEVYPWPYLDSWRAGGHRSPATAVRAAEARIGRTPVCSVDC